MKERDKMPNFFDPKLSSKTIILEPTVFIPDVYTWEIIFNDRIEDGKQLKKRIRTPKAQDAIFIAFQDLKWDKKSSLQFKEKLTIRLVDSYRDDDYKEKKCYREDCETIFRGGGVYCSHKCAMMDYS